MDDNSQEKIMSEKHTPICDNSGVMESEYDTNSPLSWDRSKLDILATEQRKSPRYKGLSLKHIEFVNAYIESGFRAAETYQKIFPSLKTSAAVNVCRLLKRPDIRLEILNKLDQANYQANVTMPWFLMTCKRLAEKGNAAAINVIKDYHGISSKNEQKTTVVSADIKARARRFIDRMKAGEKPENIQDISR